MGDTTMTTSFTTAIPAALTHLQQARLNQAKEWATSFIHHNDIICGGYRFRWDKTNKRIIANPGHPLEMTVDKDTVITFLFNEMEKGSNKRLEYRY
jgi:hypothetical protein